jgi:hypothetical protein
MFAIYTEVKKTLLAVHTMLSNRPLPFPFPCLSLVPASQTMLQ